MARQKKQYEAPVRRPRTHEDFLFHAITITAGASRSYENWEADHARKRRFRVTGLGWFYKTARLTGIESLKFGIKKGTDIVADNPNWRQIACRWDEPLSPTQFDKARSEPVFFSKAVYIIAAGEALLARMIDAGNVRGVDDPKAIYERMKILPCCFNIDGFNASALGALEKADPRIVRNLVEAAEQSSSNILSDLAEKRKCVSRRTAFLIANYLNRHHDKLGTWSVRAKPGGWLGRKAAVADEEIDEDKAGELPVGDR